MHNCELFSPFESLLVKRKNKRVNKTDEEELYKSSKRETAVRVKYRYKRKLNVNTVIKV